LAMRACISGELSNTGPASFPSRLEGVAQLASCACSDRLVSDIPSRDPWAAARLLRARNCSAVPPASWLAGVAHPVQSLSDMRRADARSAQIRRPDGVTRSFQVSENNVEPLEASWARNLLSNDDCRAELADESEELGPEVPRVLELRLLAGRGEGLAGTRAGDDRAVVGPPRPAEGV